MILNHFLKSRLAGKSRLFLALMLSVLVTGQTGCGYTTSTIGASGFKTIYVSNFANKINLTEEVTDKRQYTGYRSGMELSITRAIIDRFVVDGNLRIGTKAQSDLIMDGDLIDFTKESLRFDSDENVIEYRLKVIVDLRVTDRETGELLINEKSFTGESTYRTSGQYAKSESAAIQDAVRDLAVRVVERVVENW